MPQERVEQFVEARKLGRNRFKALCGKGDLAQTVGATPVTNTDWTVWARLVSDPDPMIVYFTPTLIPFTILVHNLPILLRIEDDGRYWISGVDYGDYLAAIGSSVLPVNYADFIHTHANDSSGGQLNISNAINAGVLAQQFGGTGANLSASTVGSIFYQNAFGQFVALAAVASGNVLRSAGLTTAPAYGKVVMTTDITGITPVPNGGTGKSSNTTGALLLGAGASAMTELAPGASGNLAQSNGTVWQSAAPSFDAAVITSGQLALARGGTNADLSATGAGHLIQATAGAALSVIKDNFAATAAPNPATDDNTAGYAVGSLWLDTTNDDIYMAIDVSTGAAVWEHLNATSGGSSPFTTTSNVTHLVTPTDTVTIGGASNLGKLAVVGDDPNEVTTRVRGASGQSVDIFSIEDNSGNSLLGVTSAGALRLNADQAAAADLLLVAQSGADLLFADVSAETVSVTGSTSLDGAVTINEAGADVDFRVESDTQVNALFLDGATGALRQLGNAPSAYLHMAASTTALASGLIPAGTAPSSPVAGQFWNEATYQTITGRFKGNSLNAVWTLFAKTDLTTVSGTTAETSILGTVIPSANASLAADFFTVGCSMLIHLGGFYSVSSGSDTSCILRVKLDSVNVLQFTLPTLTGASNQAWQADILITCRTTGAAGNFISRLKGVVAAGATSFAGGGSVATVDTTDAKTFDITIDPNTTSTSFRCDTMIIEIQN